MTNEVKKSKFVCPGCGHDCKSPLALRKHVEAKHPDLISTAPAKTQRQTKTLVNTKTEEKPPEEIGQELFDQEERRMTDVRTEARKPPTVPPAPPANEEMEFLRAKMVEQDAMIRKLAENADKTTSTLQEIYNALTSGAIKANPTSDGAEAGPASDKHGTYDYGHLILDAIKVFKGGGGESEFDKQQMDLMRTIEVVDRVQMGGLDRALKIVDKLGDLIRGGKAEKLLPGHLPKPEE